MRLYYWKKPILILTPTTGGSLPNGTYYLYARFRYRFTSVTYCGTTPSQSPKSDVQSIELTGSNNAIQVNWKFTGDISGYADGGGGKVIVTSYMHSLETGNTITIISGAYAGTYSVTRLSHTTFSIVSSYKGTETSSWESTNMNGLSGTTLSVFCDTSNPWDANGYYTPKDRYIQISTQGTKITTLPTETWYYNEIKAWPASASKMRAYELTKFDYENLGTPYFDYPETTLDETNLNNELSLKEFLAVGIYAYSYYKVFNMPFNFNAPNLTGTAKGWVVHITGYFDTGQFLFKRCSIILEVLNSHTAYCGGHIINIKTEDSLVLSQTCFILNLTNTQNTKVIGGYSSWGIYPITLNPNNTGWTHGNDLFSYNLILYDTGKHRYTYTTPENLSVVDELFMNWMIYEQDPLPACKNVTIYNGKITERGYYRPAGGFDAKFININTNYPENRIDCYVLWPSSDPSVQARMWFYRQKIFKIVDKNGNPISNAEIKITLGSIIKKYQDGMFISSESATPSIYQYQSDVNGYVTTGTDITNMILESKASYVNDIYKKATFIYLNCIVEITKIGYNDLQIVVDVPKNIPDVVTLISVLEISSISFTHPTTYANGTISLVAAGGVAPYQYSIDGGTSWHSSGDFTGLLAGSYDIMVKDNEGTIVEGGTIILKSSDFINVDNMTIEIGNEQVLVEVEQEDEIIVVIE